jgi:sugar diacid utilization regulator
MKNYAKTHELRRRIIKSMADNDLNIAEVARQMHYHRHAIEYHCKCIRRDTGLDPRCLYGLIKLLEVYDIQCEGEGATTNEGASASV